VNLQEALPTIQVVALGVNALLVLVIFPLRKSVENLSESDKELANRIQALEVKVAENYIQRGEVTASLNSIVHKLERIEARLDAKVEQLESSKADK
jgi:hypothetical protein